MELNIILGWVIGIICSFLYIAIDVFRESRRKRNYETKSIVRCKDCKNFNGKEVCSSLKGLTFPTPNDYCSYREQRESK